MRRISLGLVSVCAIFGLSAQAVLARVPNDTYYDHEWYLEKIAAPEAWDVTRGNRDVVVAVLDTGIDLDHPDLARNLWTNRGEIADNNIDDDDNGSVDDVNGWDFVDDDADPSPESTSAIFNPNDPSVSHGTFIAGVIGAETDNASGYAGIVWNARVMPLRILNEEGGGMENDAAAAVDYAVANGARVINLSFAGDQVGRALTDSVRKAYEAGVVIVAALGNDGRDVNVTPVYPACLRSATADWVIGVAAVDEQDAETDFTNYGSNCADLSAPGERIFGLRYSDGDSTLRDAQISWSGTSAASPMVAGAAALLLAAYPDLTPDNVRTAMKLSVDPIVDPVTGRGSLGVGRLNVARALAVAASLSSNPVPQSGDETSSGATPVDGVKPPSNSPHEWEEDQANRLDGSFIALGANAGDEPRVKLYKATGEAYTEFLAYAPTFKGGVNAVLVDIDDKGGPEVIVSPGAGGGPHVRIFTLAGAVISEFFAFDPASRKGVELAAGDVDGDGEMEIVTAVGDGVSDDVVVWNTRGEEESRFTVKQFAPGTRFTVAVGDVDDDWESEIIVAAMNGEPRVAVFNHDGSALVDFLAYAPNMQLGLSVALGDFDHDSRDEIVTSPRRGAPGHIRIFNKIGALWGEFFVTDQKSTAGAKVAVADMDVDGQKDIVIESGKTVSILSPFGEIIDTIEQILIPERGTSLSVW